MKTLLTAIAACLALATSATAGDVATYRTSTLAFDDVAFGLESAILDKGLVIESVNHVGDMLERTRGDVGSDVILFDKADIYEFCSATLSRQVMEVNPLNLIHCPYSLFVAQEHGSDEVIVGHRTYGAPEMKPVQDLLSALATAAIEE